MRKGVVRAGVALALVASGVWAAMAVVDLGRRVARPDTLGGRLDRLAATVAGLGLAQADYLMPGQDPAPALGRFSQLLAEATAATADLGPLLHTDASARALDTFADHTSALVQNDSLVRERVLFGDVLAAAPIIQEQSRTAVSGMQAALRDIDASEAAFREQERAALLQKAGTILGGEALLWVCGLLVVIATAGPRRARGTEATAVAPAVDQAHAVTPIDMSAAADLCAEMARVETPAGVEGLVARAAGLLGASRVILWVGGGEALFPVMVHGGSAEGGRPGPVRRDADQGPARAWRRAAIQTVPSDAGSPGEICAPMVGPSGCSGVFAVQVAPGREADSQIRAVTTMIAAQLSTVVTGLPAAGAAPPAAAATGT